MPIFWKKSSIFVRQSNHCATWIFLIATIALGIKLVGIRFFKLFTSQRSNKSSK